LQHGFEYTPHDQAIPRIWQPWTWKDFDALQQPDWDVSSHNQALSTIASLPPLVSANEIEQLKEKVGQAAYGRNFLLQGGDCAERFQDCNEEHISGRLKILMQMGLVISYGSKTPVVPIGRMAGQYAKPRSELFEKTNDGLVLNAFRGENVNSFNAVESDRRPDPTTILVQH
jgi:3-deoxy-7-phosphoheptulonate synthase